MGTATGNSQLSREAALDALLARLQRAESAFCAQRPAAALELKFAQINAHLEQLESRLGISSRGVAGPGTQLLCWQAEPRNAGLQPRVLCPWQSAQPRPLFEAKATSAQTGWTVARHAAPVPEGESQVYKRLHKEISDRGVKDFRLVRVPGPYYEKPLEYRAERLKAASKHHLCKTMVMENTRLPEELADAKDPRLSKYFLVLVQYTASIHAEKLRAFVHQVQQFACLPAHCNAWDACGVCAWAG
jgi:hypothetical protein